MQIKTNYNKCETWNASHACNISHDLRLSTTIIQINPRHTNARPETLSMYVMFPMSAKHGIGLER